MCFRCEKIWCLGSKLDDRMAHSLPRAWRMIYWHVEKNSTCIYSQLKSCSSSEVAAMIEGVLRHCTNMDVEKNYVDTHGQSEIGFAFCHLLGFRLMPRLKSIHRQKLY